jgi:hypothetical protein
MTSPKQQVHKLESAISNYRNLPEIDMEPRHFDAEHAVTRAFLYYLMPTWIAAGLADWWWHKQTDIEHTSGTKESIIHALQFTEVGIPILMGLVCKINAGTLLVMWGTSFVHFFTGIWDVAFATRHREVSPREQHTHSFLDTIPFTACAFASFLHWDELRSLIGLGHGKPDFRLQPKRRKIPDSYWPVLGAMIASVALVYGNELYRCRRARNDRHYNTGFYEPED